VHNNQRSPTNLDARGDFPQQQGAGHVHERKTGKNLRVFRVTEGAFRWRHHLVPCGNLVVHHMGWEGGSIHVLWGRLECPRSMEHLQEGTEWKHPVQFFE